MESIKAPFTDEQVKKLNEYQNCEWVHPFTCCSDENSPNCQRAAKTSEGLLLATTDGWICPCGQYKQNWAHAGMAKGLPPDWRIEFLNKAKKQRDEKKG